MPSAAKRVRLHGPLSSNVRPHKLTVSVIATERLILRSAVPADFEPLFESVFSDPSVARYLNGSPLSRDRAYTVFNEAFDHEGSGRKIGVLLHRESNELIGYAGLKPCDALGDDDFELGFVLKRSAWGLGYATEVGKAQVRYGFGTMNRPRLLAQVRPENTASVRALSKIGMSFVKEYERASLGAWQIYCCIRGAA